MRGILGGSRSGRNIYRGEKLHRGGLWAVLREPKRCLSVNECMAAERRAIPITADDRERHGGVIEVLRASAVCDVTVQRLLLGDYQVDGRLLFERKTMADLVGAIIEGRLFTQALRLAKARLRPAMIVEGADGELAQSGMRWEAIQGALVSVTLFCGISLLRTRTPEETARTIVFAAQQGQAFFTGGVPRHGYRPRGKYARQLFILQGLPGIGPERARRLLARFGSVQAIIAAGPEKLREVPGIGAGTARKMRWSVEEPPREYVATQ
jgi:ERCC4-type nuclease